MEENNPTNPNNPTPEASNNKEEAETAFTEALKFSRHRLLRTAVLVLLLVGLGLGLWQVDRMQRFFGGAAPGEVTLRLEPALSSVVAVQSSSFKVYLDIPDDGEVTVARVGLTFDSSKLETTGITFGPSVESGKACFQNCDDLTEVNSEGEIGLGYAASGTNSLQGSVLMATIDFKAKTDAVGSITTVNFIPPTADSNNATDVDGQNISGVSDTLPSAQINIVESTAQSCEANLFLQDEGGDSAVAQDGSEKVRVMLNPGGQEVMSVSGYLTYDSSKLSVDDLGISEAAAPHFSFSNTPEDKANFTALAEDIPGTDNPNDRRAWFVFLANLDDLDNLELLTGNEAVSIADLTVTGSGEQGSATNLQLIPTNCGESGDKTSAVTALNVGGNVANIGTSFNYIIATEPTNTPTPTPANPTATPTNTPTPQPTATLTPTPQPTNTPVPTATLIPTATPILPTGVPSATPTTVPTSTSTPVPPSPTPTPSWSNSDLSGDGIVNSSDYARWIGKFIAALKGQSQDAQGNPVTPADLNGDGIINTEDFREFVLDWIAYNEGS